MYVCKSGTASMRKGFNRIKQVPRQHGYQQYVNMRVRNRSFAKSEDLFYGDGLARTLLVRLLDSLKYEDVGDTGFHVLTRYSPPEVASKFECPNSTEQFVFYVEMPQVKIEQSREGMKYCTLKIDDTVGA